jgi:hypothetical protein
MPTSVPFLSTRREGGDGLAALVPTASERLPPPPPIVPPHHMWPGAHLRDRMRLFAHALVVFSVFYTLRAFASLANAAVVASVLAASALLRLNPLSSLLQLLCHCFIADRWHLAAALVYIFLVRYRRDLGAPLLSWRALFVGGALLDAARAIAMPLVLMMAPHRAWQLAHALVFQARFLFLMVRDARGNTKRSERL